MVGRWVVGTVGDWQVVGRWLGVVGTVGGWWLVGGRPTTYSADYRPLIYGAACSILPIKGLSFEWSQL